MNVENMTAIQYVEAEEKAKQNGSDKLVLAQIHEELDKMPSKQEQLAFELLHLASTVLDSGRNPGRFALPAILMQYVDCLRECNRQYPTYQ